MRSVANQVFEGELVRLRRENGALRDQLQRALKELKFYQHRYPSAYAPGNRGDEVCNGTPCRCRIREMRFNRTAGRATTVEDFARTDDAATRGARLQRHSSLNY